MISSVQLTNITVLELDKCGRQYVNLGVVNNGECNVCRVFIRAMMVRCYIVEDAWSLRYMLYYGARDNDNHLYSICSLHAQQRSWCIALPAYPLRGRYCCVC
jgi:hypothetical protein